MEVGGRGMDKVTGRDVLKKFICPTRPSLKLELFPNEDEDEDDDIPIARPAWRPRGLPGRGFKKMNYEMKYVDKVVDGRLK